MNSTYISRSLIKQNIFLSLAVVVLLIVCQVSEAYAQQDSSQNESGSAYDPWEGMNRGTFWFNERVDQNVIGPLAKGYDDITNESIQTGVTNFFENLKFPTLLAADLLQAKFTQALHHTGRFVINSTVGVLGIMDVASDIGLPQKEEDFGLVFANWGIPEGPYFVVPFLGPSTVRNTVGTVFDILTSPSNLLTYTNVSSDFKFWWPLGSNTLTILNLRNNYDDAIKAGREGSLDYYTFQQSPYYQYRHGLERGEHASRYGQVRQGADSIDDELDAILNNSRQ